MEKKNYKGKGIIRAPEMVLFSSEEGDFMLIFFSLEIRKPRTSLPRKRKKKK